MTKFLSKDGHATKTNVLFSVTLFHAPLVLQSRFRTGVRQMGEVRAQ